MAGPLNGGDRTATDAVLRPSLVAVAVSTTTVLPLFLTAGLAVQIGSDLDFTASQLGVAPAAFFGAGAVVSPFAGRVVALVGSLRAMRVGVLLVALLLIVVAGAVGSLISLVGTLAVAGAVNGLTQPATNLYVAEKFHIARRGAAYGAKYAAIPTASLLAGLAVPALGLTVGWRWAFGLFALVAVTVAITTTESRDLAEHRSQTTTTAVTFPHHRLLVLATGAGFAAAGASALAVFMVAGGVHAGLSQANAGLLFAMASGVGIAARLLTGVSADRRGRHHLEVVAAMLVIGAVGIVALASGSSLLFLLGAPIAFGAGWGWPGLFILAVVQRHPLAPAAATGTTQTGTSVGCVLGPLAFGLLVEHFSYGAAWAAACSALLLAAFVLALARGHDEANDDERRPHMSVRELVYSYFSACSREDSATIARHFCDDAVVYDTNHKPVRGATAIGEFFVRVRERWGGAVWEVNTYLASTDAAAIEWTMRGWKQDQAFAVRGSEHYEFRDGRIAEIRQYWTFDQENPEAGLRDFPYEHQKRFASADGGG